MDTNAKIIVVAIVALLVGVGVGYGVSAVMSDTSDDEEYYFYLYFEAGDERNGWYSAAASDATVAFDKAMNKADLKYDINSYGYLGSVDETGSMWSCYDYIYKSTSSEAAEEGSDPTYLNGWNVFAGYGEGDAHKISQSVSTIFFMSIYDDSWHAESPGDVDDWMNSGPFKA